MHGNQNYGCCRDHGNTDGCVAGCPGKVIHRGQQKHHLYSHERGQGTSVATFRMTASAMAALAADARMREASNERVAVRLRDAAAMWRERSARSLSSSTCRTIEDRELAASRAGGAGETRKAFKAQEVSMASTPGRFG